MYKCNDGILFHDKSNPYKPDRELTETNWNKMSSNQKDQWNLFVQHNQQEVQDNVFFNFCSGIEDKVRLVKWEYILSHTHKPQIKIEICYGPTDMHTKYLRKNIRRLFTHFRWSGLYSFFLRSLTISKKRYDGKEYNKYKKQFLETRNQLVNARLQKFLKFQRYFQK